MASRHIGISPPDPDRGVQHKQGDPMVGARRAPLLLGKAPSLKLRSPRPAVPSRLVGISAAFGALNNSGSGAGFLVVGRF